MSERVEHLWTVLCRKVQKDEQGALSLIGLTDAVRLPALPEGDLALQLRCFVVSNWRRNSDPGARIRERLMLERREDGSRVQLTGPTEVVLETKHLFCTVTQIDLLPIRGYGQYLFVVQRQDSDGGEWRDAPPTAGLWVASEVMWPVEEQASQPKG